MLSLEDLKIKFLVRFPGFKDIFNRVDLKIDNSISTACTDGYTLFFSSEYMSTLTEEQQLFVFTHELLHVALEHIVRSEGKNHKNWNIATDAVINAYIKKCGIQSPDNLVDIVDALNYSAEQLYEKLQKEDEEKEKKRADNVEDNGKKGSGTEEIETNGGSSNNDDKDKDGNSKSDGNKEDENPGFDDHSRWEEGLKRHKEEEAKNGGKDKSNKEGIDEREAFDKNDKEKERKDRDFINGKSESGSDKHVGGQSGSGRRGIDGEVGSTNVIDWQRLLRDAVRIDYDYDDTNLEEDEGILIHPFEPVEKPKTEIVIDCSGSISDTLIRNFLSETMTIIKNSETDVGFFDTKFSGFTRVRNEQDIKDIDIPSSGGTDFNAAVNAFTNRAENKIIFTDGHASMPNKYCDAIWVVVGYHPPRINPPGGKVIYIQGEQYDRLREERIVRHR